MGLRGEEALLLPCWRLPGSLQPCPLDSVNGNAAGRAVLPRELGNPGHLERPACRFPGVLCGHDAPFWAQAAASRAVSKANEQFAVRELLLDPQSAVLCPRVASHPALGAGGPRDCVPAAPAPGRRPVQHQLHLSSTPQVAPGATLRGPQEGEAAKGRVMWGPRLKGPPGLLDSFAGLECGWQLETHCQPDAISF